VSVTRLRRSEDEPSRRAGPSRPAERRFTDRWYRRRRVHVALGLLIAVLAALWAGQRAAQGVRDNLDQRLRDAGAGTDAGIVAVEAEQLAALRSITFTGGVGHALARHDVATLNRVVTPLQANSGVPMVDVVLPNGRVALAVRAKGAPAPVASRAGLTALRRAIRTAHGARGGRFSELVTFRSGPTFLTAGPLFDGSKAVGVVLVMTPLADLLGRLSQEVGVRLTAYDASGVPVATTAAYRPANVAAETARAVIGGGPVLMRYSHAGEREAVGRLVVDHQPDALLGAALHDDAWVTGRAVTLYAAIGLACTMLIVGSFALRLARVWWR
jgi:hypothetical protein